MEDNRSPLISVITPVYNGSSFLEGTIRSVQKQTYNCWELIIIDDASTDTGFSIAEKLAEGDKRIRLVSLNKNRGAAVARNAGLKEVRGDYVAFLDADDEWCLEKLEKQLDFMLKNNYQFSFTAYEIIESSGESTQKFVDHVSTISVGYEDMLKKQATLGCSTVMIDAGLVGRYRMPLMRKGQDYAFWLKILRDGHRAHCLPEVLTQYRVTPGSLSRNKFKKAACQWHIYRKHEQIPLFKSLYYFSHYAYRALTR